MAGFFDTLMGLGAAHQQHVQALTAAFHNPDMQAARDQLAGYLQGLNELQLLGFRTSLGILASNEGNPQAQQGLQWIAENMDGLRAGHFKAVTPQSLPRNGLTLEQVSALITPWAQMSTPQVQQQSPRVQPQLVQMQRAPWEQVLPPRFPRRGNTRQRIRASFRSQTRGRCGTVRTSRRRATRWVLRWGKQSHQPR